MKFVNLTLLIVSIASFSSPSFAAAKGPAKAKVEVTSVKEKNGAKLIFKTVPTDGLVINAEGPWKLEIKNIMGAKTTVTELKRSDWKEETAGFEVPVTIDGKAKTADVQFKLISFVCTKDKSQCFREVVEDKASVKI